MVCLETGMPGDIIQNADDALRIFEKINSPYLGLSYDFGNAYYANKGNVDFVGELNRSLPLLKILHFKDVKLEEIEDGLTITNCIPGQGVIDFEQICKFLKQKNIILPITIEVTYFCESRNWDPFEIKNSVKTLEEIEDMVIKAVTFVEEKLK